MLQNTVFQFLTAHTNFCKGLDSTTLHYILQQPVNSNLRQYQETQSKA